MTFDEFKETLNQVENGDHLKDRISARNELLAWAQAALESRVLAQPVEGALVNFWGMNPLEIGKGASLPMIPDSWRYGFRKTADGFEFSAQDTGQLVAWDAVKDAVAQARVLAERKEPMCEDCGDGIVPHNPGVCGTCYAMKYAHPTPDDALDAARWRTLARNLEQRNKLGQLTDLIETIDAAIDRARQDKESGE
jgi:hypothetical protein